MRGVTCGDCGIYIGKKHGRFRKKEIVTFGKYRQNPQKFRTLVRKRKTCQNGVDKNGGSCYNPQCCREKRQRRSLKTIQREIIVQETVRF